MHKGHTKKSLSYFEMNIFDLLTVPGVGEVDGSVCERNSINSGIVVNGCFFPMGEILFRLLHFPLVQCDIQMKTSGLLSSVPPNQAAKSSSFFSSIVEAWQEGAVS